MSGNESIQPVDPFSLIHVKCPLCGEDDGRVLYEPWNTGIDPCGVLSASGGVRGTQRIVKCPHCRLIYVDPRPRPEEVIRGYSSAKDEVYVGAAASRQATFRRCVQLGEKYSSRARLLDVGAAAGFFVRAARDAGWDAMGVEPCLWLTDYALRELGISLVPTTLAEAGFPDDNFDVVTMWDVLEHVPDPLGELKEVFRVLRPGGLLMVNFPDVGTWQARLAGKHWWFFLSVHLTYFTQETILAMMKTAGFVDFTVRPHFQSLELGHLFKMAELYSKSFSRIGSKICGTLKIEKWPILYYASQTNLICHRPSNK
jgi:2-polyprenyl-3-methyl-5-hydroxy-6-metoxy-1,4-benzoquinol methylase